MLDQQNRHTGVAQFGNDVQNVAHNARRQTEAGFVQHQQAWLGHQGAPDRQHLALATGQGGGELLAAFAQAWKALVDRLQVPIGAALTRADAVESTQTQIVLDREIPKQFASLGHQRHALRHPRLDFLPSLVSFAIAYGAAAWKQAHDGGQQGGLAGAVGADHGHDATGFDIQADAMQGLYLAVTDHQIAHLQQRRAHEDAPTLVAARTALPPEGARALARASARGGVTRLGRPGAALIQCPPDTLR